MSEGTFTPMAEVYLSLKVNSLEKTIRDQQVAMAICKDVIAICKDVMTDEQINEVMETLEVHGNQSTM